MGANALLITGITLAGIFGLVLGYALGRLDWLAGKVLTVSQPAPIIKKIIRRNAQKKKYPATCADPVLSPRPQTKKPQTNVKIEINETKFVAPVDTGGMERLDTNELGTTTVTTDGVQDAAARLAQLKGN